MVGLFNFSCQWYHHKTPLMGCVVPSPVSLDSHPRSLPKTGDMEDYCEICQKHFCNKYYLKKHKQDVHGIMPDNPPTKRSRTTPASPLNNSNSTPTSLAASMNNMSNVMFLNPFLPMLQGQPMLQAAAAQAAQSGSFPPGLPGIPPLPHMPSPPSSTGEQTSQQTATSRTRTEASSEQQSRCNDS